MGNLEDVGLPPAYLPYRHASSSETKGEFKTEKEAHDFFCECDVVRRWFRVYREVKAEGLFCPPSKESPKNGYRYDVLLLPSSEAIDAGWSGGAIVIEVKRSGEKVGPGLSQAMDYLNSFTRSIPGLGGVVIVPTYAFLFPAVSQGGPIASIQMQNKIGCAYYYSDYSNWSFHSGEREICKFNKDKFEPCVSQFGNKTGSR